MFSIVAVKICFNLDFLTFTPQMKTAPKETRPQQRARSTRPKPWPRQWHSRRALLGQWPGRQDQLGQTFTKNVTVLMYSVPHGLHCLCRGPGREPVVTARALPTWPMAGPP